MIDHPATTGPSQSLQKMSIVTVNVQPNPLVYRLVDLLLIEDLLLEDPARRGITSCCDLTSKVTASEWYCWRSYASCIAIPAVSFGNQMIGGGAINSGAYRIPATSSAWSVNDNGGIWGGASGCVRAARSVAVRSSNVSVSESNASPQSVIKRMGVAALT